MKLTNYIVLIIVIYILPVCVYGQISQDSVGNQAVTDTLGVLAKPTEIVPDSLFNPILTVPDKTVSISKDSLDEVINYGAKDTQWYDHKTRSMHLFGDAYVDYVEKKLTAGYIIFDMENNIASAFSIKDENGLVTQLPTFDDGERTFTYDQLKYNFKKQKGIVYDAITTESGLYVHGSKTKYVSAEAAKDSIFGHDHDIVYNKDAVITSCNHPDPHFGIRASKMKVVTDRVAVIGPSNLELAGIPTPLWLPFGFFPLTNGESSGFIFPEDYRYSPERGFGFQGMGWYFPLNDYINLVVKGDFYANGTHGLELTSNYKKKYKYSGRMTLRYSNIFTENAEAFLVPERSFAVGIDHTQDPKAHPYVKIGGSVNFQVNSYSAAIYNDANSVLNNVYTSNFSVSHSLPRTPFNFSAAFKHRQNTVDQTIDVTLPDIQLRMNTVYPFKRKNSSGSDERWYEKINVKYDSEFKNFIESTDSTIFTNVVWDEMRSGIGNNASAGASFKVLKYFSINPTITANSDWVFQKQVRETVVDTSGNVSIVTKYVDGVENYLDYSVGTSINTQVFASLPATKGWFRGYRHTIKPNLSLRYAPDTRSQYEQILRTGTGDDDFLAYSPFQSAAVSIPGLQDRQGRADLSIGGVVEMKYYSKKDSTEKKIKLLDNLNFSSGYNMAVDSFQFNKASIRGTSRMFKGLTTFSFGFGLDPYQETIDGRIDQFVSFEDTNFPVRLDDAFFKLTTSLRMAQVLDFFRDKNEEEGTETRERAGGRGGAGEKKENEPLSIAAWVESLRIDHDVQYNIETNKGVREGTLRANTIRLSGQVPLTKKWDLNIGNISYDFKNKSLVYPTFGLSRNLHCWRMNFSWAPSRGTYSFFIGVANSNLNFLKYDYGRSNLDGSLSGRLR